MTLGVRGIGAAVVVAAVVGVVFPYATLRLGFGPNVSIVSTLLGYAILRATRARGRHALHAAHVAGVAAGQTAFMGVALVALEILRARHGLAFGARPSLVELFVWLASAGVLGIFAALPLRRHYIEDEKLTFAAGAAAAETILALEAEEGSRRTPVLAASFAASVAFTALRPIAWAIGPLGVGSGILLGARVALSMGLGWGFSRLFPGSVLPWVASALMVSGGLTAAVLRLPALLRAARRGLSTPPDRDAAERGQMRWPLVGVGGALLSLCAVDNRALHLPVSLTLTSVALAAPLLLVGTRVLGETNWAPVLSLATVAQAALGVLSPGCVTVTMVGSAVAGAIPNGGQHMMQSFRAAAIVGARTRDTVLAQLLGVIVGAAALAATSPLFLAPGVTSPLSEAWATFAEAFAGGTPNVPTLAVALAGATGVGLALSEKALRKIAPSAAALGIGMLVPGGLVAGVVIGSALAEGTKRYAPKAAAHGATVASGLVAGEALTAAALAALG
ncbi:MAG TPA: OPT/YSL family transporter [Polyangiaceae bacterium]